MGYAERIQTMERAFWMGGSAPRWGRLLLLLMESSLAGQMANSGQDGNGRWSRRRLQKSVKETGGEAGVRRQAAGLENSCPAGRWRPSRDHRASMPSCTWLWGRR